jgi:hypothetical protein
MADVASRKYVSDPTLFLQYFTSTFTPPQMTFWTLFLFHNKLLSKNLFRDVERFVALGIVELTASKKRRFWWAWCNFLALNFPQHEAKMCCRTPPQRVELLAAFAQHVRTRGVSRTSKQVRTQPVKVALCAISTAFQMDHEPSPLVTAQGKYRKKSASFLKATEGRTHPQNQN